MSSFSLSIESFFLIDPRAGQARQSNARLTCAAVTLARVLADARTVTIGCVKLNRMLDSQGVEVTRSEPGSAFTVIFAFNLSMTFSGFTQN